MSLNEFLLDAPKPWLNIRVNNLTIDDGTVISNLTASSLVATDAKKELTSNVSTLSPVFTGLGLSGLTASLPVKTNGSKSLASGQIVLTSDVSGVLPIANGGTNSSAAITNNRLVSTSGGGIVSSSIAIVGNGNGYAKAISPNVTLVANTPASINFVGLDLSNIPGLTVVSNVEFTNTSGSTMFLMVSFGIGSNAINAATTGFITSFLYSVAPAIGVANYIQYAASANGGFCSVCSPVILTAGANFQCTATALGHGEDVTPTIAIKQLF